MLGEAPGCEQWLVHRDLGAGETVRVSEVWSSREQCESAFVAGALAENAQAVMGLLDGPPELVDGEPLGGARDVRGSRGATAFPILDAPDLSQDSALLDRYELDRVGEARYVRQELGAAQTGLTHYRLLPGRRQGWAHRHGVTEEIYVALGGDGCIIVDGDPIELRPLVAVRVAPRSVRELEAGATGLEVLAFGTHVPGDGEMVAESPGAV